MTPRPNAPPPAYRKPRRLAAPALLALLAALAAGPAAAQTSTTLVSNTGQANSASRGVDTNLYAQAFGTGSNTAGYDLDSIVLDFDDAPTGIGTLTVTVRADASGDPSGTALYTLTTPDPIADDDLAIFTAPTGATLDADSTYWVVASYNSASGGPRWWRVLLSNGIDSGGATGWTIDSPFKIDSRNNPDGWAVSSASRGLKLQVKGTVKGTTTTSTDATLSGLALSGVTLDPTFVSTTETYTATVVNSVTETTVTATVTHSGATVAFKDGDDNALTSPVTLAVGANVIKAEVTAEDTTTIKTYMVTVTREAATTACLAPTLAGRTQIWTGTVMVGAINIAGITLAHGFSVSDSVGTLDDTTFSVGSNNYVIDAAFKFASDGKLRFSLASDLSTTDRAQLTLHVCDDSFAFSAATLESLSTYDWSTSIDDWSSETTRTLYLSVPSDDTTTTTVPGAPTGLTATASGTSAIDLAWTAPSNDGGSAITGYRIEVSSDGVSSWTDLVADTDNTNTTYEDHFPAGTTRHYRVSAINSVGTGAASNVATLTVPGAPTGLMATASGTNTINLSWTAPSNDGGSAISGYRIEVSSDGGSSWISLVVDTDDTNTTYEDRQPAGTTRHYRVSAINSVGTGAASNVDDATTATTTLSTDATLSALALSGGTLAPTFVSTMETYTATVGNSVTATTVTATPTHSGATVAFKDGDDNALTSPVSLAVGDNVIKAEVTAEDTTTMKTYMVTVTRAGTITTPPEIVTGGVQVTSTPATGDTYVLGETIAITVTFDKAVTVDTSGGTPRIQFRLGPPRDDKWAEYSSGSGGAALVFTYTVQARDMDDDGIWLPAEPPPAPDAARSAPPPTTPSTPSSPMTEPGLQSGHKVDGSLTRNPRPAIVTDGVQVTSMPMATADTYGLDETIAITVTFDKAVTVDTSGGTPRIAFRVDGDLLRWAEYSSGSEGTALVFTYTVQAGDMDADGIRLGVKLNRALWRHDPRRRRPHRRRHPHLCRPRPAERAQGGRLAHHRRRHPERPGAERRHARPDLRVKHGNLHRNGGERRHGDHGDGDPDAVGRDGRVQGRRRQCAHQSGDPCRGRHRHQGRGDGPGRHDHEDLHGDGGAGAQDRHRAGHLEPDGHGQHLRAGRDHRNHGHLRQRGHGGHVRRHAPDRVPPRRGSQVGRVQQRFGGHGPGVHLYGAGRRQGCQRHLACGGQSRALWRHDPRRRRQRRRRHPHLCRPRPTERAQGGRLARER